MGALPINCSRVSRLVPHTYTKDGRRILSPNQGGGPPDLLWLGVTQASPNSGMRTRFPALSQTNKLNFSYLQIFSQWSQQVHCVLFNWALQLGHLRLLSSVQLTVEWEYSLKPRDFYCVLCRELNFSFFRKWLQSAPAICTTSVFFLP